MRNKFTASITLLALLSISAPAFARHDDDHGYRGNNQNHGDNHGYNRGHKGYSKHYQKQVKKQYNHQRNVAVQESRWEWKNHNWNEQRNYVHSNWQSRSARINAAQRAQLDAQLRTQWNAYHNNNWNGSYDWNQYNDPEFLDYIHDRNPSVLTQIRNVLGF